MRVVVVMPARNEAELISSSIASVPLSVDWIVVVDDGSTDSSGEIAQNIVNKGFATLLKIPSRMGKPNAINLGVEASQYPILLFSDVRQTIRESAI